MRIQIIALLSVSALASACGMEPVAFDECMPVQDPDNRFVINGTDSPQAFEYSELEQEAVVGMMSYTQGFWQKTCSGSIVAEQWVLTAAHCVFDFNSGFPQRPAPYVAVNIGRDSNNPLESLSVAEVIVHPDYVEGDTVNDIALVRLTRPISLEVQRMLLPLSFDFDSTVADLDGLELQAGGFGQTEDGGSNPFRRWVTMEAANASGFTDPDRDLFVVPVESGTGVCFGDSGSPIVRRDEDLDRVRVVGVASRLVSGSCQAPIIYTAVQPFAEWIQSYISDDEFTCVDSGMLIGSCSSQGVNTYCQDGLIFTEDCLQAGLPCGVNQEGLVRCFDPLAAC